MQAGKAVVLLCGLALAGCADRHAGDAVAAQSTLVGMPKTVLLSCAGAPDRMESVDGAEILTYVTRSMRRSSGPTGSFGVAGGSGGGFGMGLGLSFGTGSSSRGCTATFTLAADRVSRLVYRDEAGRPGDACYAIVENCLALRPPGQ